MWFDQNILAMELGFLQELTHPSKSSEEFMRSCKHDLCYFTGSLQQNSVIAALDSTDTHNQPFHVLLPFQRGKKKGGKWQDGWKKKRVGKGRHVKPWREKAVCLKNYVVVSCPAFLDFSHQLLYWTMIPNTFVLKLCLKPKKYTYLYKSVLLLNQIITPGFCQATFVVGNLNVTVHWLARNGSKWPLAFWYFSLPLRRAG